MASKPLIIATALGVAVGVPYVMHQRSNSSQKGGSPYASQYMSTTSMSSYGYGLQAQPPLSSSHLPPTAGGPPQYAGQASAGQPSAASQKLQLEHVFRFDLTKEWVYSHWARKSTGLADAEFFGVRVPLVTGTAATDIAGSLTYYFDADGVLQHIAFRGRTGDPSYLAAFLAKNYKFEKTAAPAGEQIFHVASSSGVQSELRAMPEQVLWTNSPHGNYAISLELGRPGTKRILPPRGPSLQIPPVAAL